MNDPNFFQKLAEPGKDSTKLAKLTNLVRMIKRDVKEKKSANITMGLGIRLTPNLFSECPILGAYYICCAPTSVLVNKLLNSVGRGGWKGQVEYECREHVEPLRLQGRLLIKDSRFWIRELQAFPGVMSKHEMSWSGWINYMALSGNQKYERHALPFAKPKDSDKYGHMSSAGN